MDELLGSMTELLSTLLSVLFVLVVSYAFWAPFALFFASRRVVRHLRARLGPEASAMCAIPLLAVVFLPIVMAESGSDAIPWVLPWWFGVGMRLLGSDSRFLDASAVVAILFILATAWLTHLHVVRQDYPRKE